MKVPQILIRSTLFFIACLCSPAHAQRSATPPEQIRLPKGFKIELLYSVPRGDQGSWVAMCQDDKGRLIVSDQHGGLYRFPIPKLGEKVDPASIQQITYSIVGAKARKRITGTAPKKLTKELAKLPKIGHAQGICYAFGSLYVVVSSRSSTMGCGVYRILDTDGDDNFDKLVKLKSLGDTAGEHGPHAIIPAPDGKHLYVIIGNQTKVPADYTHSRVPEVWGEDQLLPSLQYFMKGAEAPLGHIAQIDPEGKTWEIVATGFRNQYDAAFNREGELFTYDARETYVGKESTTPAKPAAAGSSEREARRALEAHLQKSAAAASKSELDKIWNSLGSPDRGIRHASRAALEKQPVAKWKDRLVREKNLVASTADMIALARATAKKSTT